MTFLLALFTHPTMLFALANLKHDAKAVWGWLCHRSFWQLMFGAAMLLAGWEYLGKRTEQRHANKSDAQLIKCSNGRQADRIAYAKAQADAAVANKAQVANVEQQSKKVSDDERQAYLSDLAQLRAARLRQQNAAPQRAPGSPGAPSAPGPATGANADGLQVPPSADVREDAAEIELRLLHLQRWVEQQLAIDPNAH